MDVSTSILKAVIEVLDCDREAVAAANKGKQTLASSLPCKRMQSMTTLMPVMSQSFKKVRRICMCPLSYSVVEMSS